MLLSGFKTKLCRNQVQIYYRFFGKKKKKKAQLHARSAL